jgi:hypothetical protein
MPRPVLVELESVGTLCGVVVANDQLKEQILSEGNRCEGAYE